MSGWRQNGVFLTLPPLGLDAVRREQVHFLSTSQKPREWGRSPVLKQNTNCLTVRPTKRRDRTKSPLRLQLEESQPPNKVHNFLFWFFSPSKSRRPSSHLWHREINTFLRKQTWPGKQSPGIAIASWKVSNTGELWSLEHRVQESGKDSKKKKCMGRQSLWDLVIDGMSRLQESSEPTRTTQAYLRP